MCEVALTSHCITKKCKHLQSSMCQNLANTFFPLPSHKEPNFEAPYNTRLVKKESNCTTPQYPGTIFGIIGQNPSVSKFNRLYVMIFVLFFIHSKHISYIRLKWSVIFLKSWASANYLSIPTISYVSKICGHWLFSMFSNFNWSNLHNKKLMLH